MEITEINTLIGTLAGTIGGLGWLFHWRANKRLKNAEADTAEVAAQQAKSNAHIERIENNYQHQIESLLEINDKHTERMARLNEANDKDRERLREMTDRHAQAEQELNKLNEEYRREAARLNDRIDRQADIIKELYLEREHYKDHLCTKTSCKTRLPYNPEIVGKPYQAFVTPDKHNIGLSKPKQE